ncbi:MAG: RDD family protein [Chloroflexi bacterium]|nr:RDD family protein [Chloroflexota bacterium]
MDTTENHSDAPPEALKHLSQAYDDEEAGNLNALRETEAKIKAEPRDEQTNAVPPESRTWADPVDAYRLSIDTPENVAFDYKVAGIGSRFLAALVDTLLILVLQLVVYGTLLLLANSLLGNLQDWETSQVTWLFAVFGLIAFAFLWGYYVFFEALWNGQSPGKRRANLRVIRSDGTPITLTESLIRNLVRLVDFLPAYYGVGVVTMFADEQTRRLGDMAAGTLVVHDRAPLTLQGLATAMNAPIRARPINTTQLDLPVERLTNRDIQMAEDFVRRRYQLSDSSAIADRITRVLLERMDVSTSQVSGMSDQDLIIHIVRANRNQSVE